MGTWGRRLVIAGLVAAALAIAGGVALLVAGGGSHTVTITSAPPPQRLQNPPWGFTGGWGDYCYRPLAGPAGYSAHLVIPSQPCPDGITRFGTAQQIELTSRAGASVDRLAVSWGAVERRPPAQVNGPSVHRFNWTVVSRAYDAMLSAGIRPIVLAYGAPEWARQNGWDRPGTCRAAYGESCAYPPEPRHIADWRAFIAALVRRFPRMVALEIWNEPNIPRFFAPTPSPALYSRLLAAAHEAARRERRPGAGPHRWAGGGHVRDRSGDPGGTEFLSGVYRQAGKASFDGIASHPYPQRPSVGRRR